MSFLDNLENNLKALEGQEQGGLDESKRRDAERAKSLAAAPWADQLKHGPFTKSLMALATRAGFTRRVKVHMLWLNTTFRLEAGTERMELRPGAKGIVAYFLSEGEEIGQKPVDLGADPQKLVDYWMGLVDAARKKQAAAIAAMPEPEDDPEEEAPAE